MVPTGTGPVVAPEKLVAVYLTGDPNAYWVFLRSQTNA